LRSAARMIAERGVERASLASIGADAGLSRGLPNTHFGSKDALVARLAIRAQDRVRAATGAELEHAHRRLEDSSALDLLRMTVDAYLKLFEDPSPDVRALIVMWGATFPSASALDAMVETTRGAIEGWVETIEAGQQDGSIRADLNPDATAVVLLGMMRGVAGLLLTDAETVDMEKARQVTQEWITSALSNPAPRPVRRTGTRAKKAR
jgi:AcrR family transcriptional regulator